MCTQPIRLYRLPRQHPQAVGTGVACTYFTSRGSLSVRYFTLHQMMAVTLAAAHLAVRVPLGLSSARAGRMPPLGVSRLQLHASITATPLPRPVSRLAPHAASGHAPAEKYRAQGSHQSEYREVCQEHISRLKAPLPQTRLHIHYTSSVILHSSHLFHHESTPAQRRQQRACALLLI